MGAYGRLVPVSGMLIWPAKRPDLNPIEMACAWIKKRLKGRHFRVEDALFEAIQKEWNDLSMNQQKERIESLNLYADCQEPD
jgi:transposase